MKKKLIASLVVVLGVLSPIAFIYAAEATSGGYSPSAPGDGYNAVVQIANPIKANNFSELAALVTKTAVQVLLPFVVLAFMYSGFLFIRAQGNEAMLEEAKKAMWYSMIGAFILLGAWSFAQIIGRTVSTLTQ